MKPIKTCSVDGCTGNSKTRGWCNRHYKRWLRYGDPIGGNDRYLTPEAAFSARTAWQDGCLVWTGSKKQDGYAELRAGKAMVYVHRYAWERANGQVPEGMEVDHQCRNRACVKIDHLRLATSKQNSEHAGLSPRNTSGYRGVNYHKPTAKWRAAVCHNGKSMHLGLFENIEEAADVARAKRLELFTHNDLDRVA